jgi:hypothetical protein
MHPVCAYLPILKHTQNAQFLLTELTGYILKDTPAQDD